MSLALEGKAIRSQDMPLVMVRVGESRLGRPLAWAFLKENWDEFVRQIGTGSFSFPNIVSRITEGFATQADLDDMNAFFAGRNAYSAEGAVALSRSVIKGNIAFLQRCTDDPSLCVGAWFAANAQV